MCKLKLNTINYLKWRQPLECGRSGYRWQTPRSYFPPRPGGATEISRWRSEAQPPGHVEEDCSRPGRDDGPEFATGPIPVRRPFRARSPVVSFPVATLRSATG